jgi:hypothetical protein
MAAAGYIKNASLATLNTTGVTTFGGMVGNSRIRISDFGGPFGILNTTGLDKIDILQAESLFTYFSTKTSLTAAESQRLFNDTGAVASQTATLANATSGALTGDDGFATNVTVQFLTGDWSSAQNIGTNNPFRNANTGAKSLIVFGGNTSTTTGAITLSLHTADGFDASAWNLIVTGNGDDVYTLPAVPGNDTDDDLTLTPGDGTIIAAGSYIYLEWTAAALVACKGLIRVSGGTLTIDTAAP